MSSRLRKKAEGWGVKLRFGEGRDEWFALDVPHSQEGVAKDRLARLQAMGKLLTQLGKFAEVRLILEEAAATRTERGFRAVEAMVEGMSPATTEQRAPKTFRKVVQELCDGSLHESYPEDIGARAQAGRDRQLTILSTFFPVLGDLTFDAITRELIDEAKKLIPKDLKASTRGKYLGELRLLLKLAVEPLRLCTHAPTVRLPKPGESDVFQLIYPEEEARVAACPIIPFEERFLYAFLARNGPRISECLQYRWDHCDLELGKMRVAKAWTKTKRARFWDLEPDVLEALRLRRKQIPDATLIFVPPPGLKFTRGAIWLRLHGNLLKAGVTRRELTETLEGERTFTTHDWRGSFVTLARALGMPDRWIMDRSGHETAAVFEKYDRGARHAGEQGLGWWAPMAIALGMDGAKTPSRLGPKMDQSWAKVHNLPAKSPLIAVQHGLSRAPSRSIKAAKTGVGAAQNGAKTPLGPAQIPILDQSSLTPAEVRELLTLATSAQQYHLTRKLVDLLDRHAAEHPNVIGLDDERRKRS